jgi:hypothetical protein
MSYTFHSDCGHGWLEVPAREIRALGIEGDISGYSYISTDGMTVYLEEDCDEGVFIKAVRNNHLYDFFDYVHHDGDCFIRELASYTGLRPLRELRERSEAGATFKRCDL